MSIGWAEVAGERLEVLRIAPERTRLPLVFLHEGLGSVAGWRDFPRTLCDRLDAPGLVYSRRGYGRSTPLGRPRGTDYLHREAWDVLPALLRATRHRRAAAGRPQRRRLDRAAATPRAMRRARSRSWRRTCSSRT